MLGLEYFKYSTKKVIVMISSDIDKLAMGLQMRNPDGALHKNDIGPNRWDSPILAEFARKVDSGLVQDQDRRRIATMMVKYANTQLPSIAHQIGVTAPSSTDLANFAKTDQQVKQAEPVSTTMVIKVEEVRVILDGDIQDRLALRFKLDCNRDDWRDRMDEIKSTMREVKSHFIFNFDEKYWHIPNKNYMVERAITGLSKEGFNTTELHPYSQINDPVNEKDWFVWTADEVGIKTPYNIDLIDEMKTVEGRRFDKPSKRWFFPIWNIDTIADILNEWNMPRLTQALRDAPERKQWVKKEELLRKASSATSLDVFEDYYSDLDSALDKVTPDDLSLRPFQKAAVGFIEMTGWKSLIADEMGCGKTIEAIGATLLHDWYTLIVCPASLKLNWVNELRKWAPDRVVCVYMPTTTIKFRKQMALKEVKVITKKDEIPDECDYLICNYESVRGDSSKNEQGFYQTTMKDFGLKLLDFEFQAIIFDECHRIKNHKTQQAAGCLYLAQKIGNILAMSGTPITSRPVEFFTILKLLKHSEFSDWTEFVTRYCDAEHTDYGWQVGGSSNEDELNIKLRSVMIRRLKENVLHDLPAKIRQKIEVEMLKPSEYHKKARAWVKELRDTDGGHLVIINNLRQEAAKQKAYAVAELAVDVVNSQDCVVIFYHHKAIGNYLAKHLADAEISVGRIDGDTSMEKRQPLVDDFQEARLQVLLCSTSAAGQGLTMTRAQTVIFAEREWVPATEIQAEDRLHRIGQVKVVHALYILASDSIDEVFDETIEEKAKILSEVMDGKKWEGSMIPAVMKDVLRRYK